MGRIVLAAIFLATIALSQGNRTDTTSLGGPLRLRDQGRFYVNGKVAGPATGGIGDQFNGLSTAEAHSKACKLDSVGNCLFEHDVTPLFDDVALEGHRFMWRETFLFVNFAVRKNVLLIGQADEPAVGERFRINVGVDAFGGFSDNRRLR
jgi:hypothetical protein